jgi:hypothetical protein
MRIPCRLASSAPDINFDLNFVHREMRVQMDVSSHGHILQSPINP